LMLEHPYVPLVPNAVERASIVEYIAGYISFLLEPQLKCPDCASALIGSPEHLYRYTLIEALTKGGLKIPSPSVVRICKIAESFFLSEKTENLNTYLQSKFALRVTREAIGLGCFADLQEHQLCLDALNAHIPDLCKLIAQKYLVLRIKQEVAMINLDRGATTRNKVAQILNFQHQ
jgi:hypothetical protein